MPSIMGQPSTTEELEGIYAVGPDAVVALVQQLVQQLSLALQANAQLIQRITDLEERLEGRAQKVERMERLEEAIRDSLRQGQVAHFDEAGVYLDGKRQ